jgi:F-type H+-transporting ATPase subunit epsilon
MAEAFKFELVSPARLLISEEMSQVVVPGSEGDFTMLKDHAPFMTTVRPGVLEATSVAGKVSKIFVRGGFADASPSGLTILAEQAVPVEELNAELIAKERAEAQADVTAAKTDEARRIAQEKLDQLEAVLVTLAA